MRGKTEEADGMLKSLDDCIQELETGNETLKEMRRECSVSHSSKFVIVNFVIVVSQNLQQLKKTVQVTAN